MLTYIISTLIIFSAIEHFYFLVLEMFLWTKPRTRKIFGLKSLEFAQDTKVLAANQGLYNGFLAVGLIISLIAKETNLSILFLSFVTIAGIYGSYSTKSNRIFFVQSLPAILALFLISLN